MKQTIIVTLLVLILGAGLFAEGAQENDSRFGDAEEVTLTGSIDISQFPAVLTADGKEYLVMVPPFAVPDVNIENGQQITVTGYPHESYGRFRSGEEVISVTSAVINGEEYEVEMPGYGGRFAYGSMHGPMMGPGGRGNFGGGYGPQQQAPRGRMPMQGGPSWGGPMQGNNQPRGWR